MVIQNTPTKIDKIASLRIGQRGENLATDIKMDVSDWITVHPDANYYCLFKRPDEVQVQPVLSSLEEDVLTWTVRAWECAVIGVGYLEVRAVNPDTGLVAKSRVIPCAIEDSVIDDEGPVPPEMSWVGEVLAAKDTAVAAKTAAEEARDTAQTTVNGAIAGIQAEGTTQVGNVNTAGATQVGAVQSEGTTQVGAVQAKGTEVLNSIPSDYTELSDDVSGLKSALGDRTEYILRKNAVPLQLNMTRGGVNSADGTLNTNTKYLRTDFMSFVSDVTLNKDSTSLIWLYEYGDADVSSFVRATYYNASVTEQNITIDTSHKYIVVCSKNPSADIGVDEINDLVNSFFIAQGYNKLVKLADLGAYTTQEELNAVDDKLGVYTIDESVSSLDATYNRMFVWYPIKDVDATFYYSIKNKATTGAIAISIASKNDPYGSSRVQNVAEASQTQTELSGSFTINNNVKQNAKYIVVFNSTTELLIPFTITIWTGESAFGDVIDRINTTNAVVAQHTNSITDLQELKRINTALDFCLESLANYTNTRIKANTGVIESTTSGLICSGKYPCREGDKIVYTLSSDNAIFATYDNNGVLQHIVNGTGYSNYISGEYTFTANDKFFAVSGVLARYTAGTFYSIQYTTQYKRYENLSKDSETLKTEVDELKAKTARLSSLAVKPNDVYYNGNLIRRCYNPYKNEGSLCLVGQLHCHTVGTASGETQYCTPAELCQLHKNNGYDFMTITDYGYLEMYGGYSAHPDSVPENFVWLFDSQECAIPSGDGYMIKHVCVFNYRIGLTFDEYISLQDMIDTYQPLGAVCSLAHPMWTRTYFTPAQIQRMVDTGLLFCEVYDGLTHQNNQEQFPDGSDTDFAWQAMLDKGMFTFGTAISDLHGTSIAELKNGCVKVFCNSRNRFDIIKNLFLGNFYSSTNVDASIESVSVVDGLYNIQTGDASATTVFMKEGGAVLKTVTGANASYQITGDEKYVRAKVTLSSGEKIWTQPVFNIIDDSYNDYTEYMDF